MHFTSISELFSTFFSLKKKFLHKGRVINDFAILENTIEVKSLS